MIATESIAARALGATQRPEPRQPWFVGQCAVAANVYPGAFERVPGCVAAAVYLVPGNPRSTNPIKQADALWLVAAYRHGGETTWTTALLGAA